jgi:hypothetical protein
MWFAYARFLSLSIVQYTLVSIYHASGFGRVAELVDALDSKSCERKLVRVRFPPRPPTKKDLLVRSFLVAWLM